MCVYTRGALHTTVIPVAEGASESAKAMLLVAAAGCAVAEIILAS